MEIYTIVVTYNPAKWLHRCLLSLKKSALDTKIIIVDNGSTDGSQQVIKTLYPEIQLIELEENIGFGQANNVGIKKAYNEGADYFFLLNQDAWIEENTIKLLVGVQKINPQYGIISPMHFNGDGSKLDFGFSNYIIPCMTPSLISDIAVNNVQNQIYACTFVNAACWLITKECIDKVGGFSPVFFQYGEDDNYVHRARFHGFKIGIYPKCAVFHDRDNRQTSSFHEKRESDLRMLKLQYSNPLLVLDLGKDLKRYKKNYFKRLLLFDFKSAEYYKSLINNINDIKDDVMSACEKSKKNGKSFL